MKLFLSLLHAGNKKACSHILGSGFDVDSIAKRMIERIEDWRARGKAEVKALFIAAPPKSSKFIAELAERLGKDNIDVLIFL